MLMEMITTRDLNRRWLVRVSWLLTALDAERGEGRDEGVDHDQ